MFWKAGVAAPPKSIGKTAIAAFSSGNFILNNWLKDPAKRKEQLPFEDRQRGLLPRPMRAMRTGKQKVRWEFLDQYIDSALKWAAEGADKRIRLYIQLTWPSLKKLVDKTLTDPPHFTSSD